MGKRDGGDWSVGRLARRLGRRQCVRARCRPGEMSKKAKPAAKPKGGAAAADEGVVTRQTALANYAKACKCEALCGSPIGVHGG